MRVLVVHNKYLSRNVGGEDIVYLEEVAALRRELGEENVFAYDVSNEQLVKWKLFFSIWFSLHHYRAVQKIIRRHSINVVHVHNFFPLLTPSVFVAAKRSGAKVFHTLHNFRWWCVAGILYREGAGMCELCVQKKFPISGIKHKCYRKSAIQSLLAQLAFSFYKSMNMWSCIDRFIVLTDFQKQKVLSLGVSAEKIVHKPHGIKTALLQSQTKSDFVFVGRLEAAKGLQSLLDVWATLGSDYQLTVVGEGEVPAHGLNIKFVGKLDHEATLKLIGKSKYLIHPSLVYETFGLTILEAMSQGTPVIGFNIGTRPEFIRDGINGFLCEPAQLAATVVRSKEYADYSALSAGAREFAQQFSDDLMVKRLVSVYEE